MGKTRWTNGEWIAFGNRVKRVRSELQDIAMDVQKVCRVRQVDGLLRIVARLDKWKASLENIAARDVSEELVTRIFYGGCLSVGGEELDDGQHEERRHLDSDLVGDVLRDQTPQ